METYIRSISNLDSGISEEGRTFSFSSVSVSQDGVSCR